MTRRSATLAAALLAGSTLAACVADGERPPDVGAAAAAASRPDGRNARRDDDRNGRKRPIYDAEGQRDYRRDFDPEDDQLRSFCQLNPGDQDCFGRRL